MARKRGFLLVCISFVVLSLCGCPISSPFPLGPVEKAPLDKDLLGKWKKVVTSDDDDSFHMEVFQFNNHELLFLLLGEKDELAVYRAFITIIDGHGFLNVNKIEPGVRGDVDFLIVNYSISDGRLHLRIIDDALFDKTEEEIETPGRLRSFIRENIDKEELFDDAFLFERLKE